MDLVAGVDEVGRGALAGPVVSSAVILPIDYSLEGLNDSKLLNQKNREALYFKIKKQAVSIGIGFSTNKEIDRFNILNATHLSMKRALENCNPKPIKALIDGSRLPTKIIQNEGIVRGDTFVPCIQAASIIAKVTRDKLMTKMNIVFPEYSFAKHKGYGTKQHIKELKKWKSSPFHRFSFKPVKINQPSIKWFIKNNKIDWIGEKIAGLYLKNKNYDIIKMNDFILNYGVIDIISKKNGKLIFSHVITIIPDQNIKSQNSKQKLLKFKNAVNYYLQKNKILSEIRLDVISVYLYKGRHTIENNKGIMLT